jgi:hypothetical protein
MLQTERAVRLYNQFREKKLPRPGFPIVFSFLILIGFVYA